MYGFYIRVMKCAAFHLGRPFAEGLPWRGCVNGFAVHLEPRAHFEQRGAHLVGNGAVGSRAEVQQQVSVLAHDIDELVYEELRRLEGVVLDVSPGCVADGRVGLPVVGNDVVLLAALEIARA